MLIPLVVAVLVAHMAVQVPNATGGDGRQVASATEARTPKQPWPPAGVFLPGGEVTSPRLTYEVRPNYTSDAMKAKVHGVVSMEVVVLADGTVGEVRVTRSLDKKHGLDKEAVRVVKKWRFMPWKKDGIAVPVLVEVEMTFTL